MEQDNSKSSSRDIYERLWKGRDSEIKYLWQKSLFWATFLGLIFKSYFDLLVTESSDKSYGILLFAFEIAGSVFSFLWIFMAKNYEFWYEKYEASIDRMQEDLSLFDEKVQMQFHKEEV